MDLIACTCTRLDSVLFLSQSSVTDLWSVIYVSVDTFTTE